MSEARIGDVSQMSEYASAVERARRAFGLVEQIEALLMRAPDDAGLQISLAGMQKMARESHEEVLRFSEQKRVEARIADLERRIAGLESRLLAVVGRVAELEAPVVAAARRWPHAKTEAEMIAEGKDLESRGHITW